MAHPGQYPPNSQPYSPQQFYPQQTYPPQGYPPQQAVASQPASWFTPYVQQVSPQERQALEAWFNSVDKNRSGSIDAAELQGSILSKNSALTSLVTFDGRNLPFQITSKLVSVFDRDRNGTIDLNEYVMLHKFISHMRAAFQQADADRSGRIEAREIHNALQGAGFSYITLTTIMELLRQFDTTRRGLDWQEFLYMAAHIAHCRSLFEW